jgi:dTDP-4-amino-4,6-dideoxygalactose transaminase
MARQSFRHLPPTATPVRLGDAREALAAIRDPRTALARLRAALLEATGAADCFLVSSGRAALTLILMGLYQESGRQRVVVPAYSCPTVAQAVLTAGLEPVFCDVSPQTLDLDREVLAGLLDRETLAIVAVHLYGLAQDIGDLLEMARALDIFVVEDAAQALGARFEGQMVGTRGDAGLYSLGRGKGLPAGHGGVIVAREGCAKAIGRMVRHQVGPAPSRDPRPGPAAMAGLATAGQILAYGLATHPRGWWLVARSPLNPADEGMDVEALPPILFRELPAARAAIAAKLLDRLDVDLATRLLNARILREGLEGLEALTLPDIPAGAVPAFLRLPVVVENEETASRLYARLWQAGLGVSRSYYRTLPDMYAGRVAADGRAYPGAERLATDLLTLPTHAYLAEGDLARIIEICTTLDGEGES